MRKKQGLKWLAFVFVCSLCAAAMSLSNFGGTQARYRTNANLTASAQVAAWNPNIHPSYANLRVAIWGVSNAAAGTAITTPATMPGANAAMQQNMRFTARNDSEVTSDFTFRITHTTVRGVNPTWTSPLAPGVTITLVAGTAAPAGSVVAQATPAGSHGMWRFAPGATAVFQINVPVPGSGNVNISRRCALFISAVQVD